MKRKPVGAAVLFGAVVLVPFVVFFTKPKPLPPPSPSVIPCIVNGDFEMGLYGWQSSGKVKIVPGRNGGSAVQLGP